VSVGGLVGMMAGKKVVEKKCLEVFLELAVRRLAGFGDLELFRFNGVV